MNCDGCAKTIRFPTAKIGHAAKCPNCGTLVRLRDTSSTQAATALATRSPPPQPSNSIPAVGGSAAQPVRKFTVVHGLLGCFGLIFLTCSGCVCLVFLLAPSASEMTDGEARVSAPAAPANEPRVDAALPPAQAQRESNAAEPSRPRMTKANYTRCVEGMTYEQVVSIVGPPDQELSSSSIAGIRTVMYQWNGGLVANANMMFQDGKLITKAQFGL